MQGFSQVGYREVLQLFGGDGCDRTGHILQLLRAVAYFDDFVQLVRIFLQDDLQDISLRFECLADVTDIGNGYFFAFRHIQAEFAVQVGDGSTLCVLYLDAGTDYGFSVFIEYGTSDFPLLGVNRNSQCRAEQQQAGSFPK